MDQLTFQEFIGVCQELTLANRNPWLKNIFLSQYLFIAILCVKMSRVNKAYGAIRIMYVTLFIPSV